MNRARPTFLFGGVGLFCWWGGGKVTMTAAKVTMTNAKVTITVAKVTISLKIVTITLGPRSFLLQI